MSKFKIILPIFLLLTLLQSCSQVFQKDILALHNKEQEWELLRLEPMADIYLLRLDLIRERENYANPNGFGGSTVLAPYHRLGFNLGNGLFFDLNDNLCLLVPELFGLGREETFEIEEQTSPRRSNSYAHTGDQFIAKYGTFFGTGEVMNIDRNSEPNTTILSQSMFSKVRVIDTENGLILKYPLGKTAILNEEKGYSVKQLIGRREYLKFGSEIILDNIYFIKERANRIEIYARKAFSDQRRLLYTMVKGNNQVIIYDRKNNGYKIQFDGNKFEYFRNKQLQVVYRLVK